MPVLIRSYPLTDSSRLWEPNNSRCSVCDVPFTWLMRPFGVHHCRACGKSVCASCSQARVDFLHRNLASSRTARVCNTCLQVDTPAHDVECPATCLEKQIDDIYATEGNTVQSPQPPKNAKHLSRTLLQLSHSPNKNTRSLSDHTSASFLLSTHPKAHPSAHTPSPRARLASSMKRTISDPLPFLASGADAHAHADAHKKSNHDIRYVHDEHLHKNSLGVSESIPTPTPFLTNEHVHAHAHATSSQNRKAVPTSNNVAAATNSKQLSIDIVPSTTERVAGDRFLASPVGGADPPDDVETYDGRTDVTNIDLEEPPNSGFSRLFRNCRPFGVRRTEKRRETRASAYVRPICCKKWRSYKFDQILKYAVDLNILELELDSFSRHKRSKSLLSGTDCLHSFAADGDSSDGVSSPEPKPVSIGIDKNVKKDTDSTESAISTRSGSHTTNGVVPIPASHTTNGAVPIPATSSVKQVVSSKRQTDIEKERNALTHLYFPPDSPKDISRDKAPVGNTSASPNLDASKPREGSPVTRPIAPIGRPQNPPAASPPAASVNGTHVSVSRSHSQLHAALMKDADSPRASVSKTSPTAVDLDLEESLSRQRSVNRESSKATEKCTLTCAGGKSGPAVVANPISGTGKSGPAVTANSISGSGKLETDPDPAAVAVAVTSAPKSGKPEPVLVGANTSFSSDQRDSSASATTPGGSSVKLPKFHESEFMAEPSALKDIDQFQAIAFPHIDYVSVEFFQMMTRRSLPLIPRVYFDYWKGCMAGDEKPAMQEAD